MRRLSIIIPHRADNTNLEKTILSVLENAPRDCQVIVADSRQYSDPYDLGAGEVLFTESEPGASLTEVIRDGLRAATADVVHLLEPGLCVKDDWIEPALEHFVDDRVATVAPLILESDKPRRVFSSGLRFSRSGRRLLTNQGARYRAGLPLRQKPLGPHWSAGFYRRSVLEQLLAAGDVVGDKLIDLDWALTLTKLGAECVSEPAAQVIGKPASCKLMSFSDGQAAQRLFLRHRDQGGAGGSLLSHPWAWLCDLVGNLPTLGALKVPCGRIAACLESSSKRITTPLDRSLVSPRSSSRTRRRAA